MNEFVAPDLTRASLLACPQTPHLKSLPSMDRNARRGSLGRLAGKGPLNLLFANRRYDSGVCAHSTPRSSHFIRQQILLPLQPDCRESEAC